MARWPGMEPVQAPLAVLMAPALAELPRCRGGLSSGLMAPLLWRSVTSTDSQQTRLVVRGLQRLRVQPACSHWQGTSSVLCRTHLLLQSYTSVTSS